MNTGLWLIRREFWENRAIWLLPAVVGAILVLASLFAGYRLFGRMDLSTLRAVLQTGAIDGMVMVAILFVVVMLIYSTWYVMDCLHADRKDRSILFWKSLPISDASTVLWKLATALIVIPLVYFAAADLTTLLMAFIISVRAGTYALWRGDLWLQIQIFWLYLIVTTAVWFLPVTAWLLVVSAWAKRAVMLWTILPLFAAAIIERLFLDSHVIFDQLSMRLGGYLKTAFRPNPNGSSWVSTNVGEGTIQAPANLLRFLDVQGFFANPQTWIGVIVAAGLILLAIRLRMRHAEI